MKINILIPPGLSYPTIATVPFSEGSVTKTQLYSWHLFENGVLVRCYREIVALWPDETIKWVHVHGIFNGGSQYTFVKAGNEPLGPYPPIASDSGINWEIEVEDSSGVVWKNTLQDRNELITIPASEYKLSLFDKKGSWTYNGKDETKFEEIKTDFLRVTRYEGWLKSKGRKSIFRYCTRVTRYLDHPLIKISHAIIFSGNMRGKKLLHISFKLNHTTPVDTHTLSGVDGANYDFVLRNRADHVIVHQRRIDKCEVTIAGNLQTRHKSDGCITKGAMSLFVRDFWQKFPQSLECDHTSITYRQWYGKGPVFDGLIRGVKERLVEENLHKLLHWHQGPYLENDIPKTNNRLNPEWADKYYAPFSEKIPGSGRTSSGEPKDFEYYNKEEGGFAEEFIEYTDNADMQGISIHDDIAIYPGNIQLQPMAHSWNNNPVGYCDPSYTESTMVSDFGSKKNDFKNVEDFIEDSVLGYTNPDRFKDYGRFLYGESHRNILVRDYRPSRKRIGLASYYCAGETYWRLRLRGGSDDILKLARRNTEHYRSVIFVSYDELKLKDNADNPIPETLGHNPGGFWYRGLWWGNIQIPDPQTRHPWEQQYVGGHGDWNTRIGRIIDPDSLFWSWILDGNRYHKDGYDHWSKSAKTGIRFNDPNNNGIGANVREFNKELVYAITAFEYYHKHPVESLRLLDSESELMKNNIQNIGNALLNEPLTGNVNGPLWQPEWIRVYAEFLVHYNTDINKAVLVSNVLNFCIRNYNSNFLDGQKTLDMATLLLDILSNKYAGYPTDPFTITKVKINDQLDWISRLTEKLYKGPDTKWFNFGVGDGELGDAFVKLQYGAFLKRLRLLGMTEEQLPEYDYPGHYPCSVQFSGGTEDTHPSKGHLARGNEYRIWKPGAGTLNLQFKFSPMLMNNDGSFTNAEIWVVAASKPIPDPKTLIQATKFISFFIIQKVNGVFTDITAINYPSNVKYPRNVDASLQHTCTLPELQQQGYFDSFSPPHNLHASEMKINSERSDQFITRNGTDNYTIQDSLNTQDVGVFRIFINAPSIYPGLTNNNLPEAMLLTNYAGSNNNSGDYMFTDSKFYYKNLENRPVTITFWASVRVAVKATDAKWSAGAFARVKKMDPDSPGTTLESYELKYEGTGYGDLGTRVTLIIPARSVVILKVVRVYSLTLVRAKIDGRLLCGRSLNDVTVLSQDQVEPGHSHDTD